MREIKFRARKSTKKGTMGHWVYGSYFVSHERPGRSEHWIIEDAVDGKKHLIYIETLGQYTGLKDKNGKEIYEGDILDKKVNFKYVLKEWTSEKGEKVICPKRLIYCCVWNEPYVQFVFETKTPYPFNEYIFIPHISDYKIIGNIHENPELI